MTRGSKKKNIVLILVFLLIIGTLSIYLIDKLVNDKVVENIDIDQSKLSIKQSDGSVCDVTYFLENKDDVDKSLYVMTPECIPLNETGKINVSIKYKNIIQGFTVVISE